MNSEKTKNLTQCLAEIQKKIKPLKKKADNPFFKSKYADLTEVTKYAYGLLAEHNLCYVTTFKGDIAIGTLMHPDGEIIESSLQLHYVPDAKGYITPQAQGSAITYARRYILMAMLGLVAEEDDDDGNAGFGRQVSSNNIKPKEKPAKPAIDKAVSMSPTQKTLYDVKKELLNVFEKLEYTQDEWMQILHDQVKNKDSIDEYKALLEQQKIILQNKKEVIANAS